MQRAGGGRGVVKERLGHVSAEGKATTWWDERRGGMAYEGWWGGEVCVGGGGILRGMVLMKASNIVHSSEASTSNSDAPANHAPQPRQRSIGNQ